MLKGKIWRVHVFPLVSRYTKHALMLLLMVAPRPDTRVTVPESATALYTFDKFKVFTVPVLSHIQSTPSVEVAMTEGAFILL